MEGEEEQSRLLQELELEEEQRLKRRRDQNVAIFRLCQNAIVMMNELMEEDNTDGTQGIDHRIFPRAERKKFRHDQALMCIKRDYLGPKPLFPDKQFEEMFRISPSRFQRMMEDIGNAGIPFYTRPNDCVESTFEARLLLPLKSMAYGVPPHAFRDYFQMSTSFARVCCNNFDATIKLVYQEEYLRVPDTNDLQAIMNLHHSVHGINGDLGKLDCMHTTWKNCPKAWAGSFQGKEGVPTIVLEALSDYHLWFWHAAYGFAGTLNDVTILSYSTLLESLLNGTFHALEAPLMPYEINGEQFTKMFILVDGIYPQYSRFVKAFKVPVTDRERKFSQWQEACRKDIERAFGVLQGKFQCMARPFHQMTLSLVGTRVAACLILHNMCVSDRVMDGDVHARYKPDNTVIGENEKFDKPTSDMVYEQSLNRKRKKKKIQVQEKELSTIGIHEGNEYTINMVTRKDRWAELQDTDEFVRLNKAIMDVTETMTNPKHDKFRCRD